MESFSDALQTPRFKPTEKSDPNLTALLLRDFQYLTCNRLVLLLADSNERILTFEYPVCTTRDLHQKKAGGTKV